MCVCVRVCAVVGVGVVVVVVGGGGYSSLVFEIYLSGIQLTMMLGDTVHFLLRTYHDLPHFERRANEMVDSRSWSPDGREVRQCLLRVG